MLILITIALSIIPLSPAAALVVCGLASGILSMLLYKSVSPQQRLDEIIARNSAIQLEMREYDGDFEGMMALTRQNLSLACRRVWLTLVPSFIGALPVLGAMAWLSRMDSAQSVNLITTGPTWLRSWLSLYLITISLSAVSTKVALRIR